MKKRSKKNKKMWTSMRHWLFLYWCIVKGLLLCLQMCLLHPRILDMFLLHTGTKPGTDSRGIQLINILFQAIKSPCLQIFFTFLFILHTCGQQPTKAILSPLLANLLVHDSSNQRTTFVITCFNVKACNPYMSLAIWKRHHKWHNGPRSENHLVKDGGHTFYVPLLH